VRYSRAGRVMKVTLERRTVSLNREGDSGWFGIVIHFRQEVICDAEGLFA